MKKTVWTLVIAGVVLTAASLALAQGAGHDAAQPGQPSAAVGEPAPADQGGGTSMVPFAVLGACLGAGFTVTGGGLAIGKIAAQALDSIARQPEAAGQLFLTWLIPAAMVEGGMLFGIVICLLAVMKG